MQIWNARTVVRTRLILAHSARVNCIEFSADGKLLATGSDDFSAAVWDLKTGILLQRLEHRGRVEAVAWSPKEKRLVTGMAGGMANVWDLETGRLLFELKHPRSSPVRHVEFSFDGERILTAYGPGAGIWSSTTGELIGPMLSHPNVYTYMGAFHPDGTSFATCGRDAVAKVWQTGTGSALSAPLRHEHGVSFVTFDATGTRLASASFDHSVRIWDWARGELLYPPLNHSSPALHAVFSRDGRSILSTDAGSTRLWDISTREPVGEIQANSIIRRCAFTPDNNYFAYQCEDGGLFYWDLRTMRHGPGPSVGKIALEANQFQSPFGHAKTRDGKRELSASKTSALLIQQPGNRVVARLPHREYVAVGVFSDDGRLLMTGSADKTARVWDAQTGVPITPPLNHHTTAMYARFSPDLRWLMTMSNGRTVYFWSLEAESSSLEELDALRELLAGRRINDAGVLARDEDGAANAEAWRKIEGFRTSRAPSPPRGGSALHEARARERELAGEIIEAAAAYGQAIEIDPENSYAHYKRALLSLQRGRPAEALKDLDQALKLENSQAAYWEARGRAFEELAKWPAARTDFERSLELNPAFAIAGNGLGRLRTRARDWNGALDAFEKGRVSWMSVVSPRSISIPARPALATEAQLDLGKYYNVNLDDARRDGDRGTDDLALLPRGLFTADGTVFEVRGAIRLLARPTALYWALLPEAVHGISIRKKCRTLHFLHSTLGETAEGTVIGKYLLHYADGDVAELPLVYGAQMRDSFLPAINPLTDPHSKLAFALDPPVAGANHAVYHTEWRNKKPDTELVMLHFVSNLTPSAPFLLAVTMQ